MCSKLLLKRFQFLDRERDNLPRFYGAKANERLRGECTKVPKMKPCEVRCGNPSQYEANRERTVTEGGWRLWHSMKGEVRVTQGFVDKGKVREKTGKRTPKASKAIKLLNYFSRRAIKGIQHSHTESENVIPGKVLQPTHPFGHETPQCYLTTHRFTSKKKKNTWYHLSNELWLSLKI